jgi:hypothetical protein
MKRIPFSQKNSLKTKILEKCAKQGFIFESVSHIMFTAEGILWLILLHSEQSVYVWNLARKALLFFYAEA